MHIFVEVFWKLFARVLEMACRSRLPIRLPIGAGSDKLRHSSLPRCRVVRGASCEYTLQGGSGCAMLVTLGLDELQVVAALLQFADLANFAKSCRAGRQIAKRVMHECDLSHLQRWCDGASLCDFFHITRQERRAVAELIAKAAVSSLVAAGILPKDGAGTSRAARIASHGPHSNWFVPSTLPHVLEAVGGWPRLKARLEERRQKKRKEAELEDRRHAAVAKRRRTIDEWLATEKPLGDAIDAVAKWEASVRDRVGCYVGRREFATAARMSPILDRYMYWPVVNAGKKLSSVKRALIAFDKTADDVAEYRKHHRLAVTRSTHPCWHGEWSDKWNVWD